jgi:hypothetical protein
VFDEVAAVVTSANMTNAGMNHNHEYGLLIEDDTEFVERIRADIDRLAEGAEPKSRGDLIALAAAARSVGALREQINIVLEPGLRAAIRNKLRKSKRREVKRLKRIGKNPTAIFRHAVLELLEDGPKYQSEVWAAIQRNFPDLCDSRTDHSPGSKRPTRRWKSLLRAMLQRLEERGKVRHEGDKYRLG